MLNLDLHSHSTFSDGTLSPGELVARAAQRGVAVLALTDHDDTGGLEAARAAAAEHRIGLIDGVEISVTWQGQTIHVVGLGIDLQEASVLGLEHVPMPGRREKASINRLTGRGR